MLSDDAHGIGSLLLDFAGVADGATDTARDQESAHGDGDGEQADDEADQQLNEGDATLALLAVEGVADEVCHAGCLTGGVGRVRVRHLHRSAKSGLPRSQGRSGR